MRYLNWDVLLFPEQERVPLREFRTTCHVMSDSDQSANPVNQRQLPIVTSFVPSLPQGLPFRVSLHTWGEPEASRVTQALVSPGDAFFFEARVLLDGAHAGGLVLNNHGPWPQVIDTCPRFDKTGNQECLRFPPFHQEMLSNTWWSAGQDLGRIKVLITEGLSRGQGQQTVFRRTKDVVCFSFQHTPIAILEDAGIAWPNPDMWTKPIRPTSLPSSPSKADGLDVDAHAHSPRRGHGSHDLRSSAVVATMPPRLLSHIIMPPPARPNVHTGEASWTSAMQAPSHPVEARKHQEPRRWGTRISASDISMADWSNSITPTSSRDVSLHDARAVSDAPVAHAEGQFEELMAAFSPVKASGTHAPPTTRVSSAASSPRSRLVPLGSAEVRITSFHSQPRAVSMTTRDAPLPSLRQPSNSSMMSRFSEAQAEDQQEAQTRILETPANEVKGRKEGKGSNVDQSPSLTSQRTHSAGASTRQRKSSMTTSEEKSAHGAGDGKRKRASLTSSSNKLPENLEGAGSSPSRRVSKRVQHDSLSNGAEPSQSPESGLRAPLGSLHNIR